jgi:hypothetical protein
MLAIAAELFLFLLGAYTTASAMRSGAPLSRPGLISLVAGVVGLIASVFIAPRVRARRERATQVDPARRSS